MIPLLQLAALESRDLLALAAAEERKAQFESELAELDSEIAEQKARVERARAARDVAEAEKLAE